MNVLLETTPLYTSRAGVARYVTGLLHGLRRVAPPGVRIEELAWPVENFGYAQPQRAVKTLWREWIWANWIAPRRTRAADVVHHTGPPMIPRRRPARHVVTLHDLAVLRFPGRFRGWQRTSSIRRLRRLKDIDRIICVSQFTADEAMRLLGLPAARLQVVHEGGWLPANQDAAEAVALPPLPADYFLFVGSLEPGKNLPLLRGIYLAAKSPLPPLVIAGERWAGVPHEGEPPREWRFFGRVTDLQLAALYRGARALLFPSQYEGFGLPVLEAMTHGCPVLCGPVASLPEIAGDAAAYADLDAKSYGAAMQRLLVDDNWRSQLSVAGFERAAGFSWEKCAEETLAVYRDAARP